MVVVFVKDGLEVKVLLNHPGLENRSFILTASIQHPAISDDLILKLDGSPVHFLNINVLEVQQAAHLADVGQLVVEVILLIHPWSEEDGDVNVAVNPGLSPGI